MKNFANGLIFTLFFLTSIGISAFVGYCFNSFTHEQLVFSVLLLMCCGIFGWWFVSHKIDRFEKTYNNLDRLTKETLHELNIPIATIVANVEMIERSLPDTKTHKRLERITKSTQTLKELYTQLDHTIRQEIFTPSVVLVDVKDIIEERLQLLSDRFGDLQVSWRLQPLMVYINVVAMGRIFDNLLMNAVKYNKSNGSIEIVVDGNQLIIRDTGRGISPQCMLHIFDQYYQVDEKTEGYGLGLSIVKHYCDFYKIGLHIDSIEDEGTSVHLIFKNISTISQNPLDKLD
jgi:signal transduction histidine kinase